MDTINPSPAVTRTEIVEAVGVIFSCAPVTAAEIVEVARSSGARPEVVALLEHLGERTYHDVRQLWAELPDLPIR
ncbi:MAG: DUF2795 domain-containing protein [Candidatus Nanopelagicales bacterium]